MSELKQAIAYLEDGIKETDNILAECSPALQAELLMQRGHYEVAIRAMRRTQPDQLHDASNPCTMSTERAAELLQESFDYMSTVMPAERRRPATAELLNAVAVAISTLRAQPDNFGEYSGRLAAICAHYNIGQSDRCFLQGAVDALDEQETQPDNAPLTLEELRGMDGERVWVQFRDFGIYALVAYHADPDGDDGDDVYLTNNLGGRSTVEEIYDQGGDIYRRKPELEGSVELK